MTLYFLAVFQTPELRFIPLWLTMIFLLVLDSGTAWLILRWSGNTASWDDRHRLALVAGWLGFFVFFCFAKDAEHWSGTSLVGLLTIAGLIWLWRTIQKRDEAPLARSGTPA